MPIKTAGGGRHAIIFKRLGPSSVKVTSDVYAHVIGSASRDADERAAALTSLFHEGIEMTGGRSLRASLRLSGFGGARYRHVARRCGSPRVLVVGGQWSRPPAQVSVGMSSTLVKVATASGPRATLRASGGVAGGSPGQAGGNVQEPILQRLGFAGD